MTVHTYTYGNATIVTYRPEQTEQEQKKHERRIEAALQQFGKAMVNAEKRESEEKV